MLKQMKVFIFHDIHNLFNLKVFNIIKSQD